MSENFLQFPRMKKLTTRQKVGMKVLAFMERLEIVKSKADKYFDIEGDIPSQIWYYGAISICLMVGIFCSIMNIIN